jgi:hypothetical protein
MSSTFLKKPWHDPSAAPPSEQPRDMPASPARLDLRSLAILRIGLAATLLVDLAVRAVDLDAHYGPLGAVACRTWEAQWSNHRFDFFPCVAAAVDWAAVHFAVQALAALALLVGLRTRFFTAASWLLLVSLHNRNGLVLNGGDVLLRSFLFWAMFLPLGERWSLDASSSRAPVPPRRTEHSVATWAFLLQLLVVYPVAIWYRRFESYWWDGTALVQILDYDLYATQVGIWLRSFPTLVVGLNHVTNALELAGPLLALVPVFGSGWLRTALVVAFVCLHLGIGIAINVGMFPIVSAVGWLALLPSSVWDGRGRSDEVAPRIGSRPLRELIRVRAAQSLMIWLAILVVAWNAARAGAGTLERSLPAGVTVLGQLLRLDQRWELFGRVPAGDGWFLLDAELESGEHVDLLRGGRPVSYEKPVYVLADVPSRRWGKLLMNLRKKKHESRRARFVRYYARLYNEGASCARQVVRSEFVFVPEEHGGAGTAREARRVLWRQGGRDWRAACEDRVASPDGEASGSARQP